MKKKLIIFAAAFCSLITVLWIVGRISGMLQFYNIPTPSNEPNLKVGSNCFSSNITEPVAYDFIVVTSSYADSLNSSYMPDFKKGSRYIYRLCGLPGEIMEMKNGILFVNNKMFDSELNLNRTYKISRAKFNLIEQADMEAMEKAGNSYMTDADSGLIIINNIMLKKYSSKINPLPYFMPNTQEGPFKWNNQNLTWTTDNFGPLKIPAGCYFVLGDNRHNALDSRYFGFVKKEDIKGVILNK